MSTFLPDRNVQYFRSRISEIFKVKNSYCEKEKYVKKRFLGVYFFCA